MTEPRSSSAVVAPAAADDAPPVLSETAGSGPAVPEDLRPTGILDGDPAARWPDLMVLGSRVPLRRYLTQMWEYREFAATVPLGQIRAQNQDTMLGKAWNLLNPLLLIGMYYLIFQVILGIESRRGVENFLPFMAVGIFTYNFTRSATHGGALAIVKNRALMQSLYFPRALLPLSATISQALSHGYVVVVMLLLLPIMDVPPRATWALLPVVLLVQFIFNAGLAMVVARITFHFRDFEKLLSYILRISMYASGVIIPINADLVSNEILLWIIRLLPFYSIIDITRQVLTDAPFDPLIWVMAVSWMLAFAVVGFIYFRRAENEYGRV